MVNKTDLATLTGVIFNDGCLWAINRRTGELIGPLTGPQGLDDFANLRNASLLMFHTLANAETWIEKLSIWLEVAGGEEAVDSVLKMQAAISVTLRCAVEGLDKIADMKKDG